MTRHPSQCVLTAAAAALVAALAVRAPADTVVLRNGQQLRGRVTIEGDKARIELDVGATLLIDRGDIAESIVDGPAATAQGEAVAISADLMARLEARERVHVLVEQLIDESEAARLKAQAALAETGRQTLPILRAAFAAGSPTQRLHLLRVLAAIGDTASVPNITAILRDPNARTLHAEAVKALGAIAGHSVVAVLTETLVNSKDVAVRTECVKVLGALRAPFAALFLAEALRDPDLAAPARAAMTGWRDPVLLPYVLPTLDAGTREARARAAARVVAVLTPAHVRTLSRLIDLYKDEKSVGKALVPGVQRLHKDFPVVGDVELLGATQPAIKNSALDALRRQAKDRRRGPTPKDWQPERDQATVPRLVLAACGPVNRALLRELAADLATSLKAPDGSFSVKVDVSRRLVTIPSSEPGPLDARRVLERLEAEQSADPQAVRVVGVTAAALSAPGHQQALAPTRAGGAIALSLKQLGSEAAQVSRRARRLALHALAQSLGIAPCRDATCPSSILYAPEDLDARSSRQCNTCKRAFDELWRAEADAAAFYYDAAGRRRATIAQRDKSLHHALEAAYCYERALQPLAAIAQWKAVQAMDTRPGIGELINRRVEALDLAEKWLTKRQAAPAPSTRRRRR